MSVVNMYCDEVNWGEVVPGFQLMQATNTQEPFYTAPNGVALLDGRFGITKRNDPFLVFTETAVLDPLHGITDPVAIQQVMTEHSDTHLLGIVRLGRVFQAELRGDFNQLGEFYEALQKQGYKPASHGSGGLYLMHHLAQYIAQHSARPKPIYPRVS